MSKTKRFLKLTAFAAAVMMSAGMSLTVCPAYADDEEEYTYGVSGDFEYMKYSDHIAICGCNTEEKNVTIPSTIEGLPVTRIHDNTGSFAAVSSLTLPDTLTEIGAFAFSWCSDLKSVTLPDSLQLIDFQAFEQCSSLSEVVFPDHPVQTGARTFDETPWLNAQRQKDPLVIVNGSVIDGRTCKGDVVIPSDVKYVSGGAFDGNNDITSLVVPSGVKNILDCACSNCENLTSVELNGAEFLDYGVFSGCNKLKDIKISGNLKTIHPQAFADNTGTATITFYGTEEKWNQVDKDPDDEYLKRAKMVFDPNGAPDDQQDPDDPQDKDILLGDVNEDDSVDVEDVVLLARFLTEDGAAVVSSRGMKNADVNKSGKPDMDDGPLILQFVAKLITEF